MRRATTTLAVAAVLAFPGAAAASPPDAGRLVPGVSLGGVRLGWTLAQVEAAWGRAYGRCRSCREETLYFNRYAFRPEGAGVTLRRGRVVAVFTLWGPGSWSTTKKLQIGDSALRLAGTYGALPRTQCIGYSALELPDRRGQSVVYVVDEKVWGFALLRRGEPACR